MVPTAGVKVEIPPTTAAFVHTGPGTLAGRYMRRFWHPICRSQDVSPGRAKPLRIMSEDFTLYRGEALPHPSPLPEGEGTTAHLLAFRCAHRGTQLSTGWVEGDDLRCFYHGWKYDASGQCIEQPAEPEPFCNRIKVRSYPTQEYLGLIFAFLGEGDPPALPRYLDFEAPDALCDADISEIYACNYFTRIDNATDMVHVTFAHFQIDYQPALGFQCPVVESHETAYGTVARGRYPDGRVEQTHFFMPNLNLFKVGKRSAEETDERDRLSWKVPVDDGHSVNFLVTRIHLAGDAAERYRATSEETAGNRARARGNESALEIAEAILTGRMRAQDLATRPNAVELEDLATMMGQGVIPDRRLDRLGQSDAGVTLVRKLWERELSKLVHGLPLTAWTMQEHLEATR
ncbi:MAG: pobA 2 [Chloroflexi bacterium]|nr:pobA 2 [Chloroflexota bacterium]